MGINSGTGDLLRSQAFSYTLESALAILVNKSKNEIFLQGVLRPAVPVQTSLKVTHWNYYYKHNK